MVFERRKLGEILVEMGSLAPAEMRLVLERQALSANVSAKRRWPRA